MVWWWPAVLGGAHTLPPALGPFVPGWADVMTGTSKENGLLVRIYYPTSLNKEEDHSSSWGSWLSHKKYIDGFAYVLGLWKFLVYLLSEFVAGDVKIPAAVNAPIAKNPSRLKTAVFSHGMGGTRFLYSGICCEMAAHGYVVAAVEHRDESAAMTWFYSESSKETPTWLRFRHIRVSSSDHLPIRSAQLQQRAAEAAKTLELLQLLDAGKVTKNVLGDNFDLSMFQDRLDLSEPVMVGHSFGGATALLTLSQTPAFRTGIILDPWMFPIRKHPNLASSINQPLLCINMQAFQIPPNLRELQKYTSGEQPGIRCNYTIKHTTHENQSDSVHLIGYWLNVFMKKIDPVVATHINNALIIRFLREHAGLEGPSIAENPLNAKSHYVVEGLTVEGISNSSKKIPEKWLTIGWPSRLIFKLS